MNSRQELTRFIILYATMGALLVLSVFFVIGCSEKPVPAHTPRLKTEDIKVGMTESEVKNILGAPHMRDTSKTAGKRILTTWWYYENPSNLPKRGGKCVGGCQLFLENGKVIQIAPIYFRP